MVYAFTPLVLPHPHPPFALPITPSQGMCPVSVKKLVLSRVLAELRHGSESSSPHSELLVGEGCRGLSGEATLDFSSHEAKASPKLLRLVHHTSDGKLVCMAISEPIGLVGCPP